MAEVELPNPGELEERAEQTFGRRVALVTAVYAVALSIASLGGSNAMKDMLLAQQEASNQWSFYQAKVVREHLNRGNKLVLETQLAAPSRLTGAERAKYETLVQRFAEEERRMGADKKELEPRARALEAARDRYQAKDPYFDFAEVLDGVKEGDRVALLSVAELQARRKQDQSRMRERMGSGLPGAPGAGGGGGGGGRGAGGGR